MRIGVDARFYNLGSAGLARYTQELVNHLAQTQTEHTFVIFLRIEDRDVFTLEQPNLEVRTTPVKHYSLREQLTLARELRAAKLDLMHFTNFNFPLPYRAPFVISINDLTLLRYAGRSRASKLKTRPMRLVMQQGARRSRLILTYSEYQKELIVKEFGVPADKVKVIYLAVDPQFRALPAAEISTFRKRVGLAKPFIMYTGQWRQHKNLVRLIKAFREVRNALDVGLVLVGKIDPAFPIIQQTIASLGLQDDVTLTGFIPDEDLPRYYNAAAVFAFPSLSEGFGLPPLEAMACGTAVASSKFPPMPEILSEAAHYFDPLDQSNIAEVLIKLMTDSAARDKLREPGFAQVQKYSWQATAQETLAAYDEVLPPN